MHRLTFAQNQNVDMVASQLRSQIVTLKHVLEVMEHTHSYKDEIIEQSLRKVEYEVRFLRKFIAD